VRAGSSGHVILNSYYAQNACIMNKIYYRGKAYDFRQNILADERVFTLLDEGQPVYKVREDELDIRSRVSLILDAYYTTVRRSSSSAVLG
jgi:hypothetical protein